MSNCEPGASEAQTDTSVNPDILTKEEEQKLRSEARIQFLTLLKQLHGRKLQATTLEGNTVTCEYEEVDRSVSKLAVGQLATPMGVYKKAVIRLNDFDHFRFLAKK